LRLVLTGYAQQSDKHFSSYIADDGSTEETRNLIKHIAKTSPVPIHHIWHENHGFRKARIHNLTLQKIKEPYVIFTDGDCMPLPNMIATHRKLAHEKTMISGSRVLLTQKWTSQLCMNQKYPKNSISSWLIHKIKGNINRLIPLIIPAHLSAPHQKLSGIHGCHLSCYTKDLIHINGFDESFEGWGREDSDLVARLLHSGIQRRDMRGTPVLHLWHKENGREHLENNNALLQACLNEKRQQAIKGIHELPNKAVKNA
ncbi:MAG: galactosyltransferase-related protein, partial [Mariprofundaceae bacterium]|nr:galactosyltransferase-related protein [Mariprofundaceae bacterium]